MDRRSVLGSVGTVMAVSVAGCMNVGGDTPEGDPDKDDDSTVEVIDTSHNTTGADCGTMDEESSWRLDGSTVVIEGFRSAPTPCHEVTVEDVSVADDHIDVTIGITSTLEGDEVCVQCVGSIEYDLELEIANSSELDNVEVHHKASS